MCSKSRALTGDGFSFLCSEIAKQVRHLTVNQVIAGSTPALGDKSFKCWLLVKRHHATPRRSNAWFESR